MAKRSISASRQQTCDEKPYDANNSFVKKVASKVSGIIPQKSWISKWFTSPRGSHDVSDTDIADDQDIDDELRAPPSKRPRIRLDQTHPPGTFTITSKKITNHHPSTEDDTLNDFLQPSLKGTARNFAASTPAIRPEGRKTNITRLIQREQNNGAANGADDNSESSESTSGCSSLIPQTRQEASSSSYINSTFANRKGPVNDQMFMNYLQSPRSLFLDGRETLSSQRPRFDASIVNNSEGNAIDRSSSNTSVLSSPFYEGNTTFGGRNALMNYKSRTGHGTLYDFQMRVPRQSVRVKPSNTPAPTDTSAMSQTAKRILEALQNYSSPVTDALKIPLYTPEIIEEARRRTQKKPTPITPVGLRHMTRELTVPRYPDIIRYRMRKQEIQDSTVAARKVSSGPSNSAPSILPVGTPKEYSLRTQDDDGNKFLGKLRAKSTKKGKDETPAETVNLTSIPLPITTMPNFDIPLPKVNSSVQPASTTNTGGFQFSSPIKFNQSTGDISKVDNFSFSEPANVTAPGSSSLTGITCSPTAVNFAWSGSSTAARPKEKKVEDVKMTEEIVGEKKAAEDWTADSYLNYLDSLRTEPKPVWCCSACFSWHDEDIVDKCPKCKEPKPDPAKLNETPAASKTSPPAEKWKCAYCSWRNHEADEKCTYCLHKKTTEKINVELDALFKPKVVEEEEEDREKMWECFGCLLKNSQKRMKCVCCDTYRIDLPRTPFAAVESDKKKEEPAAEKAVKLTVTNPPNSWECSSCMVRNDAAATSCVCCTTQRPGAISAPSSSGCDDAGKTTKQLSVGGFGDKFKKPEGSWACDVCMVSNKADTTKCVACETLKPGAVATPKAVEPPAASKLTFSCSMPSNAPQFTFGVVKTVEKKPDPPANGFTFGTPTSQPSNSTFSFGIPPAEKSTAPSPVISPPKIAENSATNKPAEQKPTFSFGVSAEKKTVNEEKTSQFVFGAAKPDTATVQPSDSSIFAKIAKSSSEETPAAPEKTETKKETASIPSFSFVAPGPVPTTADSTPALSATTTATPASTTAASFTFSAPKQTLTQSPVINFNQTSATTTTSGGFSFTNSKITNSSAGEKKPIVFGNTPVATSLFGAAAAATADSGSAKPPSFGSSEKVLAFGSDDKSSAFTSNEKPPIFGEATTKPLSLPASSTFADKPIFNNAATPSFGTTSASSTSATPSLFGSTPLQPNIFGSSGSSAFGAPSTPIFSSTKPAETAPQPAAPFSFGASSAPPTTNESLSFSAPNSAASSDKPVFSFGNAGTSTVASAPSSSMFASNFAAPSNPTGTFSFNSAAKPAPLAFGAPSTGLSSMFGNNASTSMPSTANSSYPSTSGSSGGFNFGSSSSASGGFNFGSAAPVGTSSASSASSGFNFTDASATPSSGGYQFNALGSTPLPAFDPNSRPSFNFTSGSAPAMFNATPSVVSGRKIKKAVRRTGART